MRSIFNSQCTIHKVHSDHQNARYIHIPHSPFHFQLFAVHIVIIHVKETLYWTDKPTNSAFVIKTNSINLFECNDTWFVYATQWPMWLEFIVFDIFGIFRSFLWMQTHLQSKQTSDLKLFSMKICRIFYAKVQRSTNVQTIVYFVYQFQFLWKIVDLFINKPSYLIFRIRMHCLFGVHFVSCNFKTIIYFIETLIHSIHLHGKYIVMGNLIYCFDSVFLFIFAKQSVRQGNQIDCCKSLSDR